jgi:hypothetical protein
MNDKDLDRAHALLVRLDAGDVNAKAELAAMAKELAAAATHSPPAMVYPPLSAPDFHKRLQQMRDFYALPDARGSRSGSRGVRSLLRHQRFVKAYMSPGTGYNGILLLHATGSGKTCTAISVAHMYHPIMSHPALVLTPKAVRRQFVQEIVNVSKARSVDGRWVLPPSCSGTEFQRVARTALSRDRRALQARVNAAVATRYDVQGYVEFANAFAKVEAIGRDAVVRAFSNRVVIVDEAHNLRLSQSTHKHVTGCLFRLVRACTNVKLVLLSATPMFDQAPEIVTLLNLLRENDGREPLPVSDAFAQDGSLRDAARLASASTGYVSFSRGGDPRAFPTQLPPSAATGKPRPWPPRDCRGAQAPPPQGAFELVPSVASAFQAAVVLKHATNDLSEDDGASASAASHASNVCYPDGAASEQGFRRCFTDGNVSRGGLVHRADRVDVFKREGLRKHAAKLARIVPLLEKCRGVALVYSFWLWSGVLPAAVALEEAGFTRVGGPALLRSPGKANGRTYCIVTADAQVSDPDRNARLIEQARDKDNADGGTISVILATSALIEGTDLKFVREVHIMEPWWNLGRAEQVVGRAARYASHLSLPPEERNVTVYHHVCELPGGREGSDHAVMRRALQKRENISAALRALRSEAVDCAFNKKTLHTPLDKVDSQLVDSQGRRLSWRGGDRDGSSACLFARCVPAGKICRHDHLLDIARTNRSLYEPLDDDVDTVHALLEHELLAGAGRLSMPDLQARLDSVPADVLSFAIDVIVRDGWALSVGGVRGALQHVADMLVFVPIGGQVPYARSRGTPPAAAVVELPIRQFRASLPLATRTAST